MVPVCAPSQATHTTLTFCAHPQVATLQLEWEYLAYHSGRPEYAQFVRRIMDKLCEVQPDDGLFPMYILPDTGTRVGCVLAGGARSWGVACVTGAHAWLHWFGLQAS